MQHVVGDRVVLGVADQRGVLAVAEREIDDRVSAFVVLERELERALDDVERHRRLAVPIQDARNLSGRPRLARPAFAETVALLGRHRNHRHESTSSLNVPGRLPGPDCGRLLGAAPKLSGSVAVALESSLIRTGS